MAEATDAVGPSKNGNSVTNGQAMGLRAQKKLASKFISNKSVAKVLIDETSSRLLESLSRLAKEFSGSKKEADKLIKNTIKIIVKLGILYRNNQFSEAELNIAEDFKRRFHTFIMTAVSFYEVDFTFDKAYLSRSLFECRDLLHKLISTHLTEKSHSRVDHVFNFFGNPELLEAAYKHNSQFRDVLGAIVQDVNKLMEDGQL